MPEDVVSLILPALVIGIIGLLVGAVAGYLLGGMQEPEAQESSRPKNLVETARLWRDKRSGRAVVEMDGKIADTPADLNARQREILRKTLADLRLWLGDLDERLPQTPPVAAPAAAAPATQKLVEAPLPPTVRVSPQPGAPRSAGLLLPAAREPEVSPVPADMAMALTGRSGPDKTKDSPAARSIAVQVDEIVQERLPDSPFRDRTIRVQDASRIGLQVVVDNQAFAGVGEVSDPAIQKFLRECVAEWERRSGV